MERVRCNLCGCEETKLVAQMPDWSFDRWDEQFTFVQCTNCGLVYQNPRPNQEEIIKYYPDDYDCYPVPSSTSGKQNWLLKRAVRYGMARRFASITRHKPNGKLLDIGCATGMFLEAARNIAMEKKATWEFQGVEISDYAAEIARKKGLQVFTGRLVDANFPDESFDAVTLWDVFEHLHDPKADLVEIQRILKPGGILVMRIPFMDSWDAKLFGKFWVGFEPPRHLYLFGKTTIKRMLESSGYEIVEMDTKSSRYLTFVLSLRFFLVGKNAASFLREGLIRLLNHPLSRLIFAPVFFFYGMGQRGPLLTIAAVKQAGVTE